MLTQGKVRKANREGPVRLYWSDASYTDFETREQALEYAAVLKGKCLTPVRLVEEPSTILTGSALLEAVQIRVVALKAYEIMRLDQRLQSMSVGVARLVWEDDDALFVSRGYGPHRPKRVLARALLKERPSAIADSLIRWVAKEIEFRSR